MTWIRGIIWVTGFVRCRVLYPSSNSVYIWFILCVCIHMDTSCLSQTIHHDTVFPVENLSIYLHLPLSHIFSPSSAIFSFSSLFAHSSFIFSSFIYPYCGCSVISLFCREPFRFLKGFSYSIDFLQAPCCD